MNHRALHLDPAATAKLIRRVRTQRQADPEGFLGWLNHPDPLAPDHNPPWTRREHFLACGVPAFELTSARAGAAPLVIDVLPPSLS